ncbi:aminoglycoside phosphotransferase family protein [Kribbella sp. NBC_00382]|uniref:phosphotransferase family protein n=1 Tax=Kribbella sp. NBC_00382 TaxID=2975967 RepID=UPI002E21EA9A
MDIAAMVEKACPGSSIDEVVERSGGQLSKVFEVRRTAAEPVIMKIYEPEWAWKQAKEVHVYGLLREHLKAAVPSVLHAEPGEPAFTVLTKIDGVPLSEAEPPDWKAVYVQLGELLKRIHRIPQPAYGYLTDEVLEPLPSNDAYMRRQFTKKLKEFDELGGDPQLSEKIARYVEEHAGLLSKNTAPALCHNDFHEGNVLVDPETWQVQGFIDVENAIAADPLVDLAKTECYSIWGNADKLAGLLEGYGELPTDWRPRMTLYRLYHSLELWDWFKTIGTVDPLDSIAGDMAEIVR